MQEIKILDKAKYLRAHYPFSPSPTLKDKMRCIHCDEIIIVGNYKVFTDGQHEYICCPNAPDCNGTAIDWMKVYE